jgi:hypothetical protein
MNIPAPSPNSGDDAALSNLIGAALGTPETSRPSTQDDTLTRTGNTADHQDAWFAGMAQGQANERPNAPIRTQAKVQIAAYALPDGTRVERCQQVDKSFPWAVRRNRDCLSLGGHWDYEQLPSNRTSEWRAMHRFQTAQAAIDAAITTQTIERQGTADS